MVHPLCSNKHVFKELSEYVSISIKSYIVFYAYDIIDLKNAVSIYFFRGGREDHFSDKTLNVLLERIKMTHNIVYSLNKLLKTK